MKFTRTDESLREEAALAALGGLMSGRGTVECQDREKCEKIVAAAWAVADVFVAMRPEEDRTP